MENDLVKDITFEIDDKKKLGVMRIDWAGSNGKLCNKWIPAKLLTDLKTSSKVDRIELKDELNKLQFELLSSFDKMLS